jgi:hypothetical protein
VECLLKDAQLKLIVICKLSSMEYKKMIMISLAHNGLQLYVRFCFSQNLRIGGVIASTVYLVQNFNRRTKKEFKK